MQIWQVKLDKTIEIKKVVEINNKMASMVVQDQACNNKRKMAILFRVWSLKKAKVFQATNKIVRYGKNSNFRWRALERWPHKIRCVELTTPMQCILPYQSRDLIRISNRRVTDRRVVLAEDADDVTLWKEKRARLGSICRVSATRTSSVTVEVRCLFSRSRNRKTLFCQMEM